jgi:2-polyprenyl-6-methoxyphenol hydroxylase-like FAD-dependent oxidoreductase
VARNIGIVGAGIAGLHLALYLQKHGVDATIITDRAPEDYRNSQLLNTVAHHHVTIAREDYLGVNHWNDKDHYYYHDHVFNFPQPLSFRGDFSRPSRAVDYRIYLPALMNDFTRRGGKIEYRRIEESDIGPLVDRFDLLVVSTGKGPLGQLFTYRPEHTPYSQPQRRLCVGLYTGVRQPDPMNVTLSVSPGHGEMIVIPTITFDGVANALLMENVPGGDMEELATLSYDDNPKHFLSVLLGKLEKHHPTTYDRIDTSRFRLAQPQDLLQGGVVPTVRNTVVEFDGGKCAIALGDVHSIVDPMMGQGANVASYAAFVLGEEIVNSDVLDARFCEKVDLKRQDRVLAAARWTNIMLQPPSEALGMLIGTMSQNPALANEFTENFNYPDRQWDGVSTPARIHAWINRMSAPAEPVRAIA